MIRLPQAAIRQQSGVLWGCIQPNITLAELRNGGVFLQPADAMPVHDIPLKTLEKWIAEDERDASGRL